MNTAGGIVGETPVAPDPILAWKVPGFPELRVYWYGLFLLAGTAVVFGVARFGLRRVPDVCRVFWPLWTYTLVAALVGGRLGALLLGTASEPLGRRGFVSAGGLCLGALTGWWLARRWRLRPLPVADAFAPAVAFGEAVTRVGTLMAGTAYGVPTQVPWGIVFTNPNTPARPLGVPLHPTQIYLAIGLLGVGLAALLIGRGRRGKGLA